MPEVTGSGLALPPSLKNYWISQVPVIGNLPPTFLCASSTLLILLIIDVLGTGILFLSNATGKDVLTNII